MTEKIDKDLGRVEGLDVGIEDHGYFFMWGGFNFGGLRQGFGYIINEEFIRRFLKVFEVDRLQKCNGRICWVERTHSAILKLIPLPFEKGETFDIEKWSKKESEKNDF